MTVRDEIKDVALRAGRKALESTTGELHLDDIRRLRNNLEERIPLYTGRYPILGLLEQVQSAADAGHVAAVATNAAIKRQRGMPNLGWDEELGKFITPISDQWFQFIKEGAEEAAQEHLEAADHLFKERELMWATERLCSAVICYVAGLAALTGWPHQDQDDDLRAVVGLASGSLPTGEESIYKLLQSAPQQGQDLNSFFAAAMGQPEDIRSGAYDEAGRTPDEAMLFARKVIELAGLLRGKIQ